MAGSKDPAVFVLGNPLSLPVLVSASFRFGAEYAPRKNQRFVLRQDWRDLNRKQHVFAGHLDITSPKRVSRAGDAWEGFFPYYAGFPESFASRILSTAELQAESLIFDPWNGSGTTTYAASKLGFSTVGFDINPAMVVVGRARLLPANEADSLIPLCKRILVSSHARRREISPTEPLLTWFGPETARNIRSIEDSICRHLVGSSTISDQGLRLENLSGIAAAFYLALFSVCRSVCLKFRSSNPTWFRHPRADERRISMTRSNMERLFLRFVTSMSNALHQGNESLGTSTIKLADSTVLSLEAESVDFVLTSPPYCTRIDYAAATRVELAILAPMLGTSANDLRRHMMGSISDLPFQLHFNIPTCPPHWMDAAVTPPKSREPPSPPPTPITVPGSTRAR
jgi:hypothetical protein